MILIRDFTPSRMNCGHSSAVTLGTFDGMHIGHQRILERVVHKSEEYGVQSVVVTFDRHPASVVGRGREHAPGMLTTLEEKLQIFAESGIAVAAVLRFTEQIAGMTADLFIREYLLECLGMRAFVVGYDHGFGKNRTASSDDLPGYARTLGFDLEIIPPVMVNGVMVKSSTIRALLENGDVETVTGLLGREYSLSGEVVHGSGIGEKIGIPTANLTPGHIEKIIPAQGVYSGWAEFEGRRIQGVISIGPRPTFNISENSIEIHVPDFIGDLYGRDIRIGFIRRLRDIKPFDSPDSLVEQIRKDIEASRHFTVNN